MSDKRGYAVCDVTRDQWQTRFQGVDQVTMPGGGIATLATATVERGKTAIAIS